MDTLPQDATASDPLFLAWLAGFVDGEGFIGVVEAQRQMRHEVRSSYAILLIITNTNKPILETIQQQIHAGKIYRMASPGRRKQQYQIRLHGEVTRRIVALIRPYLRIKTEQADLVLAFPYMRNVGCKGTPPEVQTEQARIYAELRRLNMRGALVDS